MEMLADPVELCIYYSASSVVSAALIPPWRYPPPLPPLRTGTTLFLSPSVLFPRTCPRCAGRVAPVRDLHYYRSRTRFCEFSHIAPRKSTQQATDLNGTYIGKKHRHCGRDCDCDSSRDIRGRLDREQRVIELDGDLDSRQRQRLLETAGRCPVHRTLEGEVLIKTGLREPPKNTRDQLQP